MQPGANAAPVIDRSRADAVVRATLLLLWAAASFGVCWFARDLGMVVAGWPINFWMAAQGGVLVFLLLVMIYAAWMNRAERDSDVGGGDARVD